MEHNMSGPAWELESEYPSFESKEFQFDFVLVKQWIENFPKLAAASAVDFPLFKKALLEQEKICVLLENIFFYAMNVEATDTKNETAKKWVKQSEKLMVDLQIKFLPVQLAIMNLSESDFAKLISDKEIEQVKFWLSRNQSLKDQMLSREEEIVFEKMKSSGFTDWETLHGELTRSIQVEIKLENRTAFISLAEAQAMTKSSSEFERKAAWEGIQKTWKIHEVSAAQALNSLAEWRLNEISLRSKKKKLHFLDQPLHNNRISRESLDVMMTEIQEVLPRVQKSYSQMAKILGKQKLDSWDLLASGPETKEKIPFEQAFDLIEKAFTTVDPELGQFARMMFEKKWIEASESKNKSVGGYCMSFPKSGNPRVFQSYKGSYGGIFTLAHELGHAYHYWVLRKLPLRQAEYPSTLAETASNVGEFALFEYLQSTQGLTSQVTWLFLEALQGSLVNIPARYDFEKQFYEQRQHGILSAGEIVELQTTVWKKWYGSSLNQIEPYFWANKSHFYFTRGFYNFPYTVGYLLSQSIYAQRERFGKEFWPRYKALLMDTGIMTCEDLVQKHLGYDLQKPEFWRQGLEKLIAKIG